MEVRPIDANALEKDIREYADITHGCGHTELANGILKGIGRIKFAPTLSLTTFRDEIYQDAVAHGLWEDEDSRFESDFGNEPDGMKSIMRRSCYSELVKDEAEELDDASDDESLFAEELSDVVIMCFSVAGRLGIDIDASIRRKMEINKGRAWKHEGEKK